MGTVYGKNGRNSTEYIYFTVNDGHRSSIRNIGSKREALEHPGEKKYGISSKRMVLGIFKKAGYILTIVVTTMVDILMDTMMEYIGIKSTIKGSFCLLITVWFILGEAISILENASRMGVKVPRFFRKIISELQKDIDGKKS